MLNAIAHWTAAFSRLRLEHGSLYDKHILVRRKPEAGRYTPADISFIDLEKMRRRIRVRGASRKNIDQLVRRTPGCTAEEHRYLEQAFRLALAQPSPRVGRRMNLAPHRPARSFLRKA